MSQPPPLPGHFAAPREVAELLLARRPRAVGFGLRWQAKAQAASLHRLAVGSVFTVFGSIIAAVCIPWRLPQEVRLALPDAAVVAGIVEQVTDDPSSPYTDRAVSYVYNFTAADGTRHTSHCFTSGPRWRQGDTLQVRHLPGQPELSLPEGGRFDEHGLIGALAVLPVSIGYIMYFGGLRRRRRAVRLLRHGEPLAVHVTQVEATRLTINGARRFRISYEPATGAGVSRTERHTASEIVALAQEALRRRRPLFLLVDSRRPARTLWIETLI